MENHSSKIPSVSGIVDSSKSKLLLCTHTSTEACSWVAPPNSTSSTAYLGSLACLTAPSSYSTFYTGRDVYTSVTVVPIARGVEETPAMFTISATSRCSLNATLPYIRARYSHAIAQIRVFKHLLYTKRSRRRRGLGYVQGRPSDCCSWLVQHFCLHFEFLGKRKT